MHVSTKVDKIFLSPALNKYFASVASHMLSATPWGTKGSCTHPDFSRGLVLRIFMQPSILSLYFRINMIYHPHLSNSENNYFLFIILQKMNGLTLLLYGSLLKPNAKPFLPKQVIPNAIFILLLKVYKEDFMLGKMDVKQPSYFPILFHTQALSIPFFYKSHPGLC